MKVTGQATLVQVMTQATPEVPTEVDSVAVCQGRPTGLKPGTPFDHHVCWNCSVQGHLEAHCPIAPGPGPHPPPVAKDHVSP
ncbi:UNVERIFIED_CONTAM: hypothetical protein FKN15_077162 [Acipenser sinensis]